MANRRNKLPEKAKDFKGTLKKLIYYMSDYKISLIIVLIFAAASTVFSIIGPKILGNAITEISNGFIGKITTGTGINLNKIFTKENPLDESTGFVAVFAPFIKGVYISFHVPVIP